MSRTTITDADLLAMWRIENDAGNGESIGKPDHTPAEAASYEGYTDVREISPDGAVVCRTHHSRGPARTIVIADCDGPWACEIPDDALAEVRALSREDTEHELVTLAEQSWNEDHERKPWFLDHLDDFEFMNDSGDEAVLAWMFSTNMPARDWGAVCDAYQRAKAEHWNARRAPENDPMASAVAWVLHCADCALIKIHDRACDVISKEAERLNIPLVCREPLRKSAESDAADAKYILQALSTDWRPDGVVEGYPVASYPHEDGTLHLYTASDRVTESGPAYWIGKDEDEDEDGELCLYWQGPQSSVLMDMSEYVTPVVVTGANS